MTGTAASEEDFPHLPKLLPLIGRERVAHSKTEINRRPRARQLDRTDFLQLLVNRTPVGLVGREYLVQFNVLHL
jgi:hypothetical protein